MKKVSYSKRRNETCKRDLDEEFDEEFCEGPTEERTQHDLRRQVIDFRSSKQSFLGGCISLPLSSRVVQDGMESS